jgi:alcohol dehydrogenase (cytochrome c)
MRAAALALFALVPLAAQVTYKQILDADKQPENWLTYSGNYSAHRHSSLTQITPANVAQLTPQWVYQTTSLGKVETTPLVVDGVMYITEPASDVTALDTRTGRPLWKYKHPVPADVRICCGLVNRGVAALGDLLFVGTVDAHLVALDAKTGHVRWDTKVADYKTGHAITAAPLVVKDKVVVGMAGGEYGVRGFLDAYDAKTGARSWRFWTVPAPGEKASETWAGSSAATGAATTWVTGSYDPELNLVYWGTGNPGPDWNGEVRQGDNLYSDCVLALDADTGKLKWHFQFTPHDVHDWDSTEVPVLIDAVVRGERRKLLLFANRNGFYYVLDRRSGQFLSAKAFVKQTWVKGFDDSGRPMLEPGKDPSASGTLVFPSVPGGTNWFSPSYSPETSMFYVAAREEGELYYIGEADYKPGVRFDGGGIRLVPGAESYGAIRGLKATTGELVWEFRLHSPPWAGVLSTAGGLIFGGTDEGDIFALDAATGKSLWHFQAGGIVRSNPMSYQSEGKQYIAIAVGAALFTFGLPQ